MTNSTRIGKALQAKLIAELNRRFATADFEMVGQLDEWDIAEACGVESVDLDDASEFLSLYIQRMIEAFDK